MTEKNDMGPMIRVEHRLPDSPTRASDLISTAHEVGTICSRFMASAEETFRLTQVSATIEQVMARNPEVLEKLDLTILDEVRTANDLVTMLEQAVEQTPQVPPTSRRFVRR